MPENIRPLNPRPGDQDELIPEEAIMADDVDQAQEKEPLDLVDLEINEASGTRTQIKAFGRGARAAARELRHEEALKRPLNITGQGATRTRTFHSKLNDAALALMDQAINEWVDSSEIEIKCVSSSIGIFEGKKPEPHLFVTVCY
ncbi:MAG: hypothetical protein KAT11_08750 [Phycisphaerae bacterium]|nr:hypothetical protein [Phycisphaerae bacterium]